MARKRRTAGLSHMALTRIQPRRVLRALWRIEKPGARALRLAALLCGLSSALPLAAQEMDIFGTLDDPFGVGSGKLTEVVKGMFAPEDDLHLLKYAHYSEIYRWAGVVPAQPQKNADYSNCAWKRGPSQSTPPRTMAVPIKDGAAWTMINIPETRSYRLWLGYLATPGKNYPVTLSLSGGNSASHTFAQKPLPPGKRGLEIEQAMPLKFEDELARVSQPSKPLVVWEYADMELNAGPTRFEIASAARAVQVDGIMISGSRGAFAPAKSMVEDEGNLYKVWCRLRVAESADNDETYSVGGQGLTFHWRRIPRGETEPMWGSGLGTSDKKGFVGQDGNSAIPVGQWTRWVDITKDVSDGRWASGGGPWATAGISFRGVRSGRAEVQLGWYPHESAALRTIAPGIGEGRAIFMMPLQALSIPPVTTNTAGAWGMRQNSILEQMLTAEDVHANHFAWGRQALEALGAAANNPTPRLVHLTTSFGAAPAAREAAARMLAAMGINDLGGLPPKLMKDLNLNDPLENINAIDSEFMCHTHDPLDPAAEKNFESFLRGQATRILKGREKDPPMVRLVMGDEIGSKGGGAVVNGLEACRHAFHDYLSAGLKAMGTNATYYGVEAVADLPFLDTPPPYAGAHANRLYYASLRFKFVLTAMYYAQFTRAAERVFPRVQTYCNFSPHPPMFGQSMNGSDWFALTRHGGANLAWGEDWASSHGSWGFSGVDVVSYYAAWVDCAARVGKGLPAGFYAVSSVGSPDNKIFSLLKHGVHWINVYAWGPMYAGAEGSNFWSESPGSYNALARATHAIGPADEIIARGTREPRRTGLLYNRAHEIWNGGSGGFQSDRLLQFNALSQAHIPAEIFLLDDCTDEKLAGYKVLYVQGYNFDQGAVRALRRWVEAGGTLVGIAGTAQRDEGNTPLGFDEYLFGATQRHAAGGGNGNWHPQALPGHKKIDTVTLRESDLTPGMTFDVIGTKFEITPTTATAVGTYSNGACAAATQQLGKGRTLLYGFQPGLIYKGSTGGYCRYTLDLLPMVAKPALATLGRMRVEYSEPQTEVCLFEYKNAAAITMNRFAGPSGTNAPNAMLSVQTPLKVKEAVSSLSGPLKWQRDGERIVIQMPPPLSVDVVILR